MSAINNSKNFNPRTKNGAKGKEIFDPVRKKFVSLTPEEWVRQQVIHLLLTHQQVPASHIGVETAITYNGCNYRADIVVYNRAAEPMLIVECKAEHIPITQTTFDQIARYNITLKVPFLYVSNGQQHYFCRFDSDTQQYVFESKMPLYNKMLLLF